MSFLISTSWIQPTSDGTGCKPIANYPANISTTKACHPSWSFMCGMKNRKSFDVVEISQFGLGQAFDKIKRFLWHPACQFFPAVVGYPASIL